MNPPKALAVRREKLRSRNVVKRAHGIEIRRGHGPRRRRDAIRRKLTNMFHLVYVLVYTCPAVRFNLVNAGARPGRGWRYLAIVMFE